MKMSSTASSRTRAWSIPPRVEVVVRLIGEDTGHVTKLRDDDRPSDGRADEVLSPRLNTDADRSSPGSGRPGRILGSARVSRPRPGAGPKVSRLRSPPTGPAPRPGPPRPAPGPAGRDPTGTSPPMVSSRAEAKTDEPSGCTGSGTDGYRFRVPVTVSSPTADQSCMH
jgi:hypothetical protein